MSYNGVFTEYIEYIWWP